MKNYFTSVGLMLGAVCLMAGQAGATMLTIGTPFNSGSWSGKVEIKDNRKINRLEAFVISGNKFKDEAGIEKIDKKDWKSSFERSDYSKAEGSSTDELNCDLHFDGKHDDNKDVVDAHPVELVILTWFDKELRGDVHCNFDGKEWFYEDHSGDRDNHDDDRNDHQNDCNPVPEPGTFVLLGAGLLGLGAYGRKRIRK
jgi:regulator of RNase E activity RraB